MAGPPIHPRMTIAMITHGVPCNSFWDLIREGAVHQTGDHTANAALRHPTCPAWKRTVVGSVARRTRDGESLTQLVTVIIAILFADTLHAAVQELAAGVGIGSPQSSPALGVAGSGDQPRCGSGLFVVLPDPLTSSVKVCSG